MTSVAFLGLGLMGTPMARRLLEAGHALKVWNRSAERAEALAAAGARSAPTPAAAAAGAEVVLTMLADPSVLAAVTEGPDGVAAGIEEGAAHVEMSTVGPAAVERLRDVLPASVSLLDAPVLGSVPQAEAGELRVFVGGSDVDVERWTPLLEVFGPVTPVGPLGSGAAAKLVVNSTLGATLAALGEAVALADGLGLDRSAALEVLGASPLGEQVARRRSVLEGGDPPLRFRLRLAEKDLDLVAAAAEAAGVDLRLVPAARAWFSSAVSAGWGERDYSDVLRHIAGDADG